MSTARLLPLIRIFDLVFLLSFPKFRFSTYDTSVIENMGIDLDVLAWESSYTSRMFPFHQTTIFIDV